MTALDNDNSITSRIRQPTTKKVVKILWIQLFGALIVIHVFVFGSLSLRVHNTHYQQQQQREEEKGGKVMTLEELQNHQAIKSNANTKVSPSGQEYKAIEKIDAEKPPAAAYASIPHVRKAERLSQANHHNITLSQRIPTTTSSSIVKVQPKNEALTKLNNLGAHVPDNKVSQIPRWSVIQDIFGSEPVILGLETCEAYRQAVPLLENRIVAPAGMFNTGTNLFPIFFHQNCQNFTRKLMQVMWGKHNVAQARTENFQLNKTKYQGLTNEEVLPIVMVRHPVSWMFSTCRHYYGAHWSHTEDNCPHLVESKNETNRLVPVRVTHGWNPNDSKFTRYASLIHVWRNWYRSYMKDVPFSEFPRLIVRLEDVVYQPEKVIDKICTCVGGTKNPRTKIPQRSVKKTKEKMRQMRGLNGTLTGGKETADLLTAWMDHAKIPTLWNRMSMKDRHVTKRVLNEDDIIRQLNYKIDF